MGYAMREIQYYTDDSREAESKRIIISLLSVIPDAKKGEAICVPRLLLLLEAHKVEEKPET